MLVLWSRLLLDSFWTRLVLPKRQRGAGVRSSHVVWPHMTLMSVLACLDSTSLAQPSHDLTDLSTHARPLVHLSRNWISYPSFP
jgi:hypothetical protein